MECRIILFYCKGWDNRVRALSMVTTARQLRAGLQSTEQQQNKLTHCDKLGESRAHCQGGAWVPVTWQLVNGEKPLRLVAGIPAASK